MSNPTLETNVRIDGFSRVDFDKKQVRKAMREAGRDVQKEARRLISRRAISGADEYPGKLTGALWRAIKYKVRRSGFLVIVRPEKTADMGKDYYPAYLHYGSAKINLAPRKNFMADALENRQQRTRNVLRNALQDALIPRK
jgi:HK97 gp10 family phage protein